MIGAGNVSTHISRHLHSAGKQISCIYSRTEESAQKLAGELGVPGTSKIEEVPAEADFYILAVPDREVLPVAENFHHTSGIWLHTAGALAMDVFKGIFENYGVLYPLQTLSSDRPLDASKLPLLLEGSSPEVADSILKLLSKVYEQVREVDSETRLAIHTAAVFANNFSTQMVHMAKQILTDRNVDPKVLDPLVEETFEKIKSMGTENGRTGPAVRGDSETMKKHRELLKDHPEWEKLYTFISREIERLHDKF
jgi:predicted short-subunit dehydrogenase-like oxidoreductase (DUF2520 family)